MRGCVVIMVDESSAMDTSVSQTSEKKKSASVATAVNSLLNRLAQGPDLDVAVVGYRTEGDDVSNVGCRWSGGLAGREFVPATELAASPVTVEQRVRKVPGAADQTFDFPIWYQPQAGGKAPQLAVFDYCQQLLANWAAGQGTEAAQPLVLNLFAGASGDGNPHQAVQNLQQLDLPSGSPLVFQAHIASSESAAVPATLYPSNRAYLSVGPMRDLFERVSLLPAPFCESLDAVQVKTNPDARGMVYNGRLVDIVRFLSLATTYAKGLPAATPPVGGAAVGVEQPEPEPPPEEFPAAASDYSTPSDDAGVASDYSTPSDDAGAAIPSEDTSEAVPSDLGLPDPMPDLDLSTDESSDTVPAAAETADTAVFGGLSTDQPGLTVFVLDRSVADPYTPDSKNACARLHAHMGDMAEMITKFAGGTIDLAVISYGSDAAGETEVRSSLEGGLAGRPYARDNEIEQGAVRIDQFDEDVPDGAGGFFPMPRRRPVLVEVEPTPAAPAAVAFSKVAELISAWCRDHPGNTNSPIVIHLTRGLQEAADVENAVGQLQSTEAASPVVVYHVLETEATHAALLYPADDAGIDDPQLQLFWRLSSPLLGRQALAAEKPAISDQSRGFVVNGRCNLLIEALKRAAGV